MKGLVNSYVQRRSILINTSLAKAQISRSLTSLRMVSVIAMSIALFLIQYSTTHYAGFRLAPGHELTFLSDVMLFSCDGTGSGLYLFILPFLAALVGGSVAAIERHSRRMSGMLGREGRGKIMNTSLASGFVLGGIGGLSPLLINLVIAAIMNPHMNFINGDVADAMGLVDGSKYVLIYSDSWLYPLYRFNQPLAILTVMLMVFILSGLFADIAVAASFFTTHRYVEVLIPFVLSMLWWMLPGMTNFLVPDQWSHMIFLFPAPGGADSRQLVQIFIGMALSVCLPVVISASLVAFKRSRDVS